MEVLERTIEQSYSSQNGQERQAATEVVNKFLQNTDIPGKIRQLLQILHRSQNQFAIYFAATNLSTSLVTDLNSFQPEDRTELRKTLLNLLAQRGEQIWNNEVVRPPLVKCYCRLQKLCWFDDLKSNPEEELVQDIMEFLKHSLAHSVIGVDLLRSLVAEISKTTKGLSLARQRKISIVFREKSLRMFWKLCTDLVRKVLNTHTNLSSNNDVQNQQNRELQRLSLGLSNEILSFDFIGLRSNEEGDDVGIIHIPGSWAPIVEDFDNIKLFFNAYNTMDTEMSRLTLETIATFASIRNSIYRGEKRQQFVNLMIEGLGNILTSKKGLEDEENRHQLARVLIRFKTNFQTKYFLQSPHYVQFIQKVFEFSTIIFKNSRNFNSTFYCVSFWTSIARGAVLLDHSVSNAPSTHLERLVPLLLKAFVDSMIDSVGSDSSPLESEHLEAVLAEFPKFIMSGIVPVGNYLGQAVESIATYYQGVASNPNQNQNELSLAERRLAWIVHIVSACYVGRSKTLISSSYNPVEVPREVSHIEAQLVTSLFQLLELHDARIDRYGPTAHTTQLELAFISFLKAACKTYLTDSSRRLAEPIFSRLSKVTSISNMETFIDRVVQKVITLLKTYGDKPEVFEETLSTTGLFWSLATNYSSSKILGKSRLMNQILAAHTQLNIGTQSRSRTAFYKALGRLIWARKAEIRFVLFVQPLGERLNQAKQNLVPGGNQSKMAEQLLSQTLADLLGVVSAISVDGGFVEFFDWFHTDTQISTWLASLVENARQLNLQQSTMWSIMKFFCEFTYNHHQRIKFPITNADGLRLFRLIAQLLIKYVKWIPPQVSPEEKDDQFKAYKFFFTALSRCLIGRYTNFGVFKLYNDTILVDLLKTGCALLFNLDLEELERYPKVQDLVYSSLETMVSNHAAFFIQLEPNMFHQLLVILLRGLQTKSSKTIITHCANAIDKLFGHHLLNMIRGKESRASKEVALEAERMNALINHPPHRHKVSVMMLQLFDLVVNFEGVYWAVSKPLLPLILLSKNEFAFIQTLMVKSQAQVSEEKARALTDLFNQLTDGLEGLVSEKMKEKWTTNLTNFRINAKLFIDLNAFYKAVLQFSQE